MITQMAAADFYNACRWLIEQKSPRDATAVFQAFLARVDDAGEEFMAAIKGLQRIGWENLKKEAENNIASLEAEIAPEPGEP